ncbi:MAG: Vitamin B12 transporter BtuB [Steroidobacteraceae bacterium]|nr:Vitamin B12 transporter BtuB [Steroidobacteraceae bacterium]
MNVKPAANALLAAMALAIAAHAEDSTSTSVRTAAGAEPTLQEVTVTAQKRAEPLQQAPLAVTAITADVIEELGITNVSDIGTMAPGFSFMPGTLGNAEGVMSIRGIPTPADPQGTLDSTIGMYVDGVYLARPTLMVLDLAELERVEVLRGPQGTLFGRNTTGGAVSMITRPPSEEFELTEKAGFSSYSGLSSRTALHTGNLFGGRLRASLSYLHDQRDGSVDNTSAPDRRDPGAFRNDAARLALRLLPSDRLTIDYTFDWAHMHNVPAAFQLFAATPDVTDYLLASPSLGGATPVISTRRVDRLTLDDRSAVMSTRINGHALTVALDLGTSTLKAITAYQDSDHKEPGYNLDSLGPNVLGLMLDPATFGFAGVAPIQLFGGQLSEGHRQFQQELTLLSSGTGPWQWAAGAFYFRESIDSMDAQAFTFVLPPAPPDLPMPIGLPLTAATNFESVARSLAAYGQVGYRPRALDDRLGITVGVRYSRDKRTLDQTQPFANSGEATFSEPTGHVSLDYRWTPDLNGYLRLSHGYRSGGFNVRSFQRAFKPETIDQLELGLKSDWLQKRLRVNAAVYASRYQDQQVSRFDTDLSGGAASIIENAGKTKYLGGEIEVTALPIEGLQISGSFSHVDIDITEVRAADGSNIADQYRPAYSPETTARAAIEYSFPIAPGGKLAARIDWSHESGIFFFPRDDDNPFNSLIRRGPTDLMNARLSWNDLEIGGSRLRLTTSLWVKNLTDEIYHSRAIDFGALGFAGMTFSEPRTYGADFTLRF